MPGGNGNACNQPTTVGDVEVPIPFTGAVKSMYVTYKTAGVSGDTVTVYVNNTSTSITCNPTSLTSCSSTGSASITTGQGISIRVSTGGTETLANMRVGLLLQ